MCPGDSTFAGGTYQYGAGVYTDSLNTINGCDSVIQTIVNLFPEYRDTIFEVICDDETFTTPDGGVENVTGVYTDSLVTVNGCDSIIVIDLTVNPTFDQVVSVEICANEFYTLPGGTVVNTQGSYTDSLLTVNNCDSVIITNLTVHPIFDTLILATICPGDSILLGGAYQTAAGNYVDSLLTVENCDSIIRTQLDLYPVYDETYVETICPGDSILLGGIYQTVAGNYIDSLNTVNGCDSIIRTQLDLYPEYRDTIFEVICDLSLIHISEPTRPY